MTLHDVTYNLLHDPKAADRLRLADDYILQKKRFGSRFVLPKEHDILKPIIERYSRSLDQFVDYVKKVRDSTPARSSSYIALHELYRTLEIRLTMQQRRERGNRALAWLEKHHPKLTYEQRQRWLLKLEQKWGVRRMAAMEDVRNRTARGRLSVEERELVLAAFWKEIDQEIADGELPHP